jgi:hypothetical protein
VDLEEKLERWVADDLISAEQAAAIRAKESAGEAAPRRRGRISLAAEALGYLGAILFVAAVLVAYGDIWDEIDDPVRLLVLGGTAALLAAAGAKLRGHEEPALDRVGGALWLLAVPIAGMFAYTFAKQVLGWFPEKRSGVFSGVFVTAVAWPLWRLRKQALQQTAFVGSVVYALLVIGFAQDTFNGETFSGLALAAFGLAWLVATELGWIEPRRAGEILGSITTLVGMQTTGTDEAGWLFVGVVVAAAILTYGIVRDRTTLLGVGAVGSFVLLPQFFTEAFGTDLSATGAVALAGAVIVVIAVFMGRRH